ncbi:TetR family transcriptional regulator [Stenotrophomonas sp. MH1]|uniref:TetR family transcriptional regulator n=1 Tax=Stenotrophomonas capsici TaxID=3110230 RepID=A0ABU5V2T9_9GAMM|nr:MULTISPECIES: TetR family transcriptional regulator [unclassified Stenotrophomonas]MEA5667683.1 TetR family transcriptional regulator [Stenotrophomonas sp. MH1]
MNTPTKRTARHRAAGRPPGTDNSRERLLELARDAFASRGYEATSLRTIAETAGPVLDQYLAR